MNKSNIKKNLEMKLEDVYTDSWANHTLVEKIGNLRKRLNLEKDNQTNYTKSINDIKFLEDGATPFIYIGGHSGGPTDGPSSITHYLSSEKHRILYKQHDEHDTIVQSRNSEE
jgi:hypothetical protein